MSPSSPVIPSRRAIKPWQFEELQFLERNANALPFPLLCAQFQSRWPHRTHHAIANKVRRSLIERSVDSEWLTISKVAAVLGRSPQALHENWLTNQQVFRILAPVTSKGLLYEGKSDGNFTIYIRRAAWRRLAHQHPAWFSGIDSDRLAAFAALLQP